MENKCYKCDRELTTGDFDGMCSDCRKKQDKPLMFEYPFIPLTKEDLLNNKELLKKLAKALKPYLDSLDNCEVSKIEVE